MWFGAAFIIAFAKTERVRARPYGIAAGYGATGCVASCGISHQVALRAMWLPAGIPRPREGTPPVIDTDNQISVSVWNVYSW